MADENVLKWNVTNWITVMLMAAVGFGLFGFAQNWWAKRKAA
jgi:hypothetical protein